MFTQKVIEALLETVELDNQIILSLAEELSLAKVTIEKYKDILDDLNMYLDCFCPQLLSEVEQKYFAKPVYDAERKFIDNINFYNQEKNSELLEFIKENDIEYKDMEKDDLYCELFPRRRRRFMYED